MGVDDQRWQEILPFDVKEAGSIAYGQDRDCVYHSPICQKKFTARRDQVLSPEAVREQGFSACADGHPDQAG